jgi:rRNA maturation RNase YbeY
LGVKRGVVSVLLCDDEEMAILNERHRNRTGTTDVLSFPAGRSWPQQPSGAGGTAELVQIGDIAVSMETAERQARAAGHNLETELVSLLAHGFLHLIGHDHESDDGEMMQLQRRVCRKVAQGRDRGRGRQTPLRKK